MATTELTGAEEVAWDLSDLYSGPDDPKLQADLASVEESGVSFRDSYYGRVAELTASELAAALLVSEEIESALDRIYAFAHLRFTTNMADAERGALVARIHEKAVALNTELLFFGLEWVALDDDQAEALLADSALDHWRHHLLGLRRYRPHLLSEPEEKILAEKSVTGSAAWSRLFSELMSAMRVDLPEGEGSLEEALAKLHGADRDARRVSAEAITVALSHGLRTRTAIFNAILLEKSVDDRLRRYPTWISARNLANDTTDEAVEALIEAAVSRYDVPQRYYRLKAKLLGLDRIEYYDRFAPVGEESSTTSWDEARRVVVEAYADFSEEAGEIVEGFFSKSWIDAPVRPDKATGAFCATTVPGVHPYVLMNYTGDRRSILTLAHELGHGLHGVLAQPLGLTNASTPLTTAETASVFGEALTFKRLLAAEDDPRRRLDLLTGRIDDAIATTFRQIAMNRFEEAVHTERRTVGEVAPDRFSELWLQTQTQLFGDSVGTEGYATWWSYIPHFLATPGYVYAYSYGFLFSLAIFRRYEQEGDAIVGPYLDLLRAGGSRPPEELAEMVGLDLGDPAIWASGIDALAEDLDEAERLAAEIGVGA